jgi:hypothetical protein
LANFSWLPSLLHAVLKLPVIHGTVKMSAAAARSKVGLSDVPPPNTGAEMKAYLLLGVWLLATSIIGVAQPAHDRTFWQDIAKNHYFPANQSADVLANELSSLLASPDPELRDELAYSILARWIYRGLLSQPTLISLTDTWRANLKDGPGETGTNSVLKRSFSALCLA